ncbi:hypothetical protein RvY_11493 [Ramazzottius varieornatus]|uniref:Laminin G domain-containing protein n=1 Tax=Ramazzottius varieornatus TaxID=947166 RepID=A0A1D1VGA9_RAMVA|nr:hypothetical protein RvY_11493 [Ramazzottius varieornatus]
MAIWKRRLKLDDLYRALLFSVYCSSALIHAENLDQTSSKRESLLKFIFSGEDGSFAQLSDWPLTTGPSSINWTLSLDFRTNISSGVLLYASATRGTANTYAGQSHSTFLQLRLIASQLELSIKTADHVESKQHHHSHKKGSITPPENNVPESFQNIVLKVGIHLNNNQWHTILARKKTNIIELCLQTIGDISSEDVCESTTMASTDNIFRTNSGEHLRVFLGGLPLNYSTHFSVLANPSVVFEPRIRGEIRNVEYSGSRKFGRTVVSKSGAVVAERMPALCEQGKLETEWRFTGKETFHFAEFSAPVNSTWSAMTSSDNDRSLLFVHFRSRSPHGFLFLAELSPNVSLTAYLQEDCLVLRGRSDVTAIQNKCEVTNSHSVKSFGDYSLHNITIQMRRDSTIISVLLDGTPYWAFDAPLLRDAGKEPRVRRIVLGGLHQDVVPVSDGKLLPADITVGHFIGTMSNVKILLANQLVFLSGLRSANAVPADLRTEYSTASHTDSITCLVEKNDQSSANLEFCGPPNFLAIPSLQPEKLTHFAVRLKTREPDGLIFFHKKPSTPTFTAVDMSDGHINVFVHRHRRAEENSGSPRITLPSARIDDGKWHNFSLKINDATGTGSVQLDDSETEFVIAILSGAVSSGKKSEEALVYIGGGPATETAKYSDIWSAQMGQSFHGLLSHVHINSQPLPTRTVENWHDQVEGLCPDLDAEKRHCDPNPCLNGGQCKEGWRRFICVCDRTGLSGDLCEKVSPKMEFDGTFLLTREVTPSMTTDRQVTDLSFRFCSVSPEGLLFRAEECASNPPHLKEKKGKKKTSLATLTSGSKSWSVFIHRGQLIVEIFLSTDVHDSLEWSLGENLGNDKWHDFRFVRRGPHVEFTLDDDQIIENMDILEGLTFAFCKLEVGGTSARFSDMPPSRRKISRLNKRTQLAMVRRSTKTKRTSAAYMSTPLVGIVQAFKLDGVELNEMSPNKTQGLARKTLKDVQAAVQNGSVYTFASAQDYIELETFRAEARLDIKLSFKTTEPNGLILFNGKAGKDFIALELVRGALHFTFDLGNGAKSLQSTVTFPLHDNRWHAAHISKPTRNEYVMAIDGLRSVVKVKQEKMRLDLSGKLYFGGVPKSEYANLPRSVLSQNGFTGCFMGLKLNDVEVVFGREMLSPARSLRMGCEEQGTKCWQGSCKNGGKCEQQWGGVACDCDMTSYTGAICSDQSIAYRFGPLPGLIIYHFDPSQRPDSRNDHVVFGLITTEDEAIIARIASFTSDDVTEFQIVGGHLFVIYNMGSEAHLLSDLKTRLNDGKYHVIRYERSGANASIQIDDHPQVSVTPEGRQLEVFNGISTVEIGGKLNEKEQSIDRPFHGIVSGFVLNGIRILDLAADADSNIVLDGYPELVSDISTELKVKSQIGEVLRSSPNWLDEMQHMETTSSHEAKDSADDLIIATTPKCRDEDESCMLVDNSKDDDLIFAQYTIVRTSTAVPTFTSSRTDSISTSTAPSVIPSSTTADVTPVPCGNDDEDCDMESSGDDSLLSARSAVARSTRVFFVSFNTTVTPAATAALHDTSAPPPTHTSARSSNTTEDGRSVPRGVGVIPVPTLASSPPDSTSHIFAEHAALFAGAAIGIIFIVGLIVFAAVRCRGSRRRAEVAGGKTYQTFTKPEPTSTMTSSVKNGGYAGYATLPVDQRTKSGPSGKGGSLPSGSASLARSKGAGDKAMYV